MRLRKRKVDMVVNEAHWEGFQDGLIGGMRTCLGYGSTSGLYEYNEIRRVAYNAGYDMARDLVENQPEGRNRVFAKFRYGVPGGTVAKCYGMARVGAKPKDIAR